MDKTPQNDALIRAAMRGERIKHRLCFDFTSVPGMQMFFDKCKADGITHPSSVPVLLAEDGGSTIWIVGRRREGPVADGTLIQKP